MNATVHAARLGLGRGWIEFKQSMTSTQDLIYTVVFNGGFVLVLFFQRNGTIPGTSVSLALATLPGLIGMGVVVSGFMGVAQNLAMERFDGTLLRAKAIPHGMVGYLVSRVWWNSLTLLPGTMIMLVAGLFFVDGLTDVGLAGWLSLAGMLVLGLLATLPWGAVVGSLVKSPQSGFGLAFLPTGALIAISGIFYPISAMPQWVQGIAQVFPVYWLGLGTRAALLPGSAVTAEIGDSWRHLETVGVLAAWAIVGFLLAPRILRRMARRESGSNLEANRQRMMQWGN
jgi:ABC-2 type transport system permease protein